MLEPGAFADAPGALWPLFALALGLLIGSFANVCIHRLPLGESVVSPRSRCPSCRAPIAAADNVPVFSYLFLKGRCRHCGARISLRYPAVELANGLLYLAVALWWGPTPTSVVNMVFVTALLVLTLIDFDVQVLPDVITLPGIGLGIAASGALGSWRAALVSALTAFSAYAAFGLFGKAWELLRKEEALGQGDWKLVAMIGAFLGWRGLIVTIFVASFVGSIVGITLMATRGASSKTKLPFGSFLAPSAIGALFVGDVLWSWYARAAGWQ